MVVVSPPSETRRKVYALLIGGRTAGSIARLLNIKPATISYHVSQLLASGYIVKDCHGSVSSRRGGKVAFYRKGPESALLDALIGDSVRGLTESDGSGVTSPPIQLEGDKPGDKVVIPTANVHHFKLKLRVIKRGDLEVILEQQDDGTMKAVPFLKLYFDYHNVRRWKGGLAYEGGRVAIELEETPTQETLYIYPPAVELTVQQIEEGQDSRRPVEVCVKIAHYLEAKGGWKLGTPQETDWQVHYGIDDPVGMGRIAQKYFFQTADKRAWTSNSDGKEEYETSDPLLAQLKLTLPDRVINLDFRVNQLFSTVETLAAAVHNIADIERVVAEGKADQLKKKLEPDDKNGGEGAGSSLGQTKDKERYGVEYIG